MNFQRTNKVQMPIPTLPQILHPIIDMNEPNEPILVHEGEFKLKRESGKETTITGIVRFVWIPNMGLEFSGDINLSEEEIKLEETIEGQPDIWIGDSNIGRFYISQIQMQSSNPLHWKIHGISNSINCIGDPTIPVDVVCFELCNLKPFIGQQITLTENCLNTISPNRLIFSSDQFTITMDQHWRHSSKRKDLEIRGGYYTLWSGELKLNKKPVGRDGAYKYLKPFNFFLYFLNGRRVSAILLHGIDPDGISIWKDYSAYDTDPYKHIHNWSHNDDPIKDSFNNLWNQFYIRWQEGEDTQEILKSIIHWYIESNNQSGRVEGAMIMALAALELLFNWIIVSELSIVSNTDSEKLTTAGKVRLIVNYLGVSFKIPSKFQKLNEYTQSIQNIDDGPDIVVFVRNNLIHSNAKNLKNTAIKEPKMMEEALQLSLYYIELSLLKVFRYRGQYYNRTSEKIENLDFSEK